MPLSTKAPRLLTRRTKIVATLGPASSTPEVLERLIDAGVNVFRLNFSHGTHDAHRLVFERAREAALRAGRHVAILADLCGPKIRVGRFTNGSIELEPGALVVVTTRPVTGEPGLIPTEYEALASDVVPGDCILLDDGRRELVVDRVVDGTEIHCHVKRGGKLSDRKGINLPGVAVSAPALTEKDRVDATFAAQLGVDYMALSFVRRASDVVELRALLEGLGRSIPIISKIEKPEALAEIDAILDVTDGVMVARGDLGVEMPAEEVPMVQRDLTRAAIERNRIVIVATQMLESMIDNARPTRAEVTDVAWAAMAGADAVMLSGETAAGSYPVEAVATMDRVLRIVEADQFANHRFGRLVRHDQPATAEPSPELQLAEGLARATAHLSRELIVRAVVVRSHTGSTARMVAAERPSAPVIAVAGEAETCRALAAVWGVTAYLAEAEELADPVALAPQVAQALRLAEHGQFLLLVTGGRNELERAAPSIRLLMA